VYSSGDVFQSTTLDGSSVRHVRRRVKLRRVKRLTVGVIGGGTVGSSVLTLLHRRESLFHALNTKLEVLPVLVRDPRKIRETEMTGVQYTSDPAVLERADILIEVMGGTTKALELLQPHLAAGKPVITANKALLAERWDALQPFATRGQLFFEASVMAGTPVITLFCTTLRSSALLELHAILNGTCNYILSRMEEGFEYAAALEEAQRLGYAEDPPTLDVAGIDAAHKLCVVARLAVDPNFKWSDMQIQGIERVTPDVMRRARERGQRLKLVGSLVADGGRWSARVRPVLLPDSHPLASSGASRAAMVVHGDACGEVFVQGGGAGGLVTASAIVGDLISYVEGCPGHTPRATAVRVPQGFEGDKLEELLTLA
jgi:homoserine dehydrogenase